MTSSDLTAVWLTLRLAGSATGVLLAIGTPLAWWLSRTGSRWRTPVEAVVAMPLVLPPTVLGFYLLLALGPRGPLGGLWGAFGMSPPVFNFSGLLIGSVIYSLPFAVQPLQAAFEGIGRAPLEAAACLRAGPLDRFFTVALPLAGRGLLSAATLGFAHTLGEFGVVLMVGGNIPGRTRVISIAIYDHVESLELRQAHQLAGGMLALSFAVLWTVFLVNRRVSGHRAAAGPAELADAAAAAGRAASAIAAASAVAAAPVASPRRADLTAAVAVPADLADPARPAASAPSAPPASSGEGPE